MWKISHIKREHVVSRCRENHHGSKGICKASLTALLLSTSLTQCYQFYDHNTCKSEKNKCFLLYILTLLMFVCFYHIMSFLCETECPVHFKSSLYWILFSVKMPVDRMRMRPWLEQQIESGQIQGLHWVNEVRVEI